MYAAMSRPALAAFEVRAIEAAGDASERAVIANENEQRVFAQLEFIELRDDATNQLIRISRHVSEVLHILLFFLGSCFRIPVDAVRSRLEGAVRQYHTYQGTQLISASMSIAVGTAVASRPRTDPYLRNYLIRLLRQVERSRKFRYQS